MAMTAVYTNFCGQVVNINQSGTSRDIIPDPLGSTAHLVDSTQTIKASYTYTPYGEIESHSGETTPLNFVGTLGYYRDAVNSTLTYIRARWYKAMYGRWMTVDPLWPRQAPFAYVSSRLTSSTDPSGLIPANVIAGLVGGLISCLASSGISLFGDFIAGTPKNVALCKAGTKCLANGLASAFGIISMNPAFACAMSIIANLISLLADLLCPCIEDPCCKMSPSICDWLKTAIGAGSGCLGFYGAKDEIVDWVRDIFGWIGKEIAPHVGGIFSSFISSVITGFSKIACDWSPVGPKGQPA